MKTKAKNTSKGTAGKKHPVEKRPAHAATSVQVKGVRKAKEAAAGKRSAAPPRKAEAAPEIRKPARHVEIPLSREAELRKELLRQRSLILGEAKKEIGKIISGENRQIVETALDDGDWSVVDLSEDISLKQLSTHRENLTKIDEALRKLREGTYGICEECGEEIDIERLKVMPFAIYCKEDQERREILEAMEREGGI